MTHFAPDPFPPTNWVFHDPAIFERELEVLFGGGWVFVGTRDQLPVLTLPLPEPLSVREVEGRLRAANRRRRVESVGPFVFAAADDGGEPLAEFLGPEQVAWLEGLAEGLGALLFEVRDPIAGNWKLVVSGAIEDYHLPFVHGRSVEPWRTEPATPSLGPRGHSSYATVARLGPTARALHRALCGGRPVAPTFANTLTFPSLLTIRLWGLTHVTTFVPQAPDRTLRITRVYGHDAPGWLNPRRAARAGLARALKAGMSVTFREDQAIVEEAQAGTLAGRDLPRGPAHAEEARVEHFLAEVGRRLRASHALA